MARLDYSTHQVANASPQLFAPMVRLQRQVNMDQYLAGIVPHPARARLSVSIQRFHKSALESELNRRDHFQYPRATCRSRWQQLRHRSNHRALTARFEDD